MQITDGKLYLNRTWKYIYPALRVYGAQPIGYLNELIKQGVGISDINFEEDDDIPKIFILVQTKVLGMKGSKLKDYDEKISRFFDYIRKQDYYIDDYLYDMHNKCCSHMVVLRFPESFKPIYKHFQLGEYSKMYTKSMVKEYFPLPNLNKNLKSDNIVISKTLGQNLEIHSILTGDPNFREEFVSNLNRDFDINLRSGDLTEELEYDYSPSPEEELFNLKKRLIID